jgi:hypothetical protein
MLLLHDFCDTTSSRSCSPSSETDCDPHLRVFEGSHAAAHRLKDGIGARQNLTLPNLRSIAPTHISARCTLGPTPMMDVQDFCSSETRNILDLESDGKLYLARYTRFFRTVPARPRVVSVCPWNLSVPAKAVAVLVITAVGSELPAHFATLIRDLDSRTIHQSHCPLAICHI